MSRQQLMYIRTFLDNNVSIKYHISTHQYLIPTFLFITYKCCLISMILNEATLSHVSVMFYLLWFDPFCLFLCNKFYPLWSFTILVVSYNQQMGFLSSTKAETGIDIETIVVKEISQPQHFDYIRSWKGIFSEKPR